MQDADLLVALAEIAGVFVGFGALIAVRSAGTGDTYEVAGIGMVVWYGIMVIAAAFTPVLISRYGVSGHELWLVCSLAFLPLFWLVDELVIRLSPERRAMMAAWPLRRRAGVEIVAMFIWLPMTIALILIILGLFPDQEPALYLTAVALLLAQVAYLLLLLVLGRIRPPIVPEEQAAMEGGSGLTPQP